MVSSFAPLVFFAHRIAGNRRGEPALRAQRQALTVDIARRLADPAFQFARGFDVRDFRADDAENDALVVRNMAQRRESAGPLRIVFQHEGVDIHVLENPF